MVRRERERRKRKEGRRARRKEGREGRKKGTFDQRETLKGLTFISQ
jgi:hypothetical protein